MIILNSNDAFNEFKSCNYFDNMKYDELEYRINTIRNTIKSININININKNISKENLKNMYKYCVNDFTQVEKNALIYIHKIAAYLFKYKLPLLCPDTFKIKYIKLKENIDWNYPYTINHCIVIPQLLINDIISAVIDISDNNENNLWNVYRKNYNNINKYVTLLCHEMIHISQRYRTKLIDDTLNNIYINIWGFNKISININNKITNPDTNEDDWTITINRNTYYLLLTLYNNIPTGFLMCTNTSKIYSIDNTPEYTKKFYGLKTQLYHPNEIFAHLVADYIGLNKIYTRCWDSYRFYSCLNKFI